MELDKCFIDSVVYYPRIVFFPHIVTDLNGGFKMVSIVTH